MLKWALASLGLRAGELADFINRDLQKLDPDRARDMRVSSGRLGERAGGGLCACTSCRKMCGKVPPLLPSRLAPSLPSVPHHPLLPFPLSSFLEANELLRLRPSHSLPPSPRSHSSRSL